MYWFATGNKDYFVPLWIITSNNPIKAKNLHNKLEDFAYRLGI